jgi:hypothetical protein
MMKFFYALWALITGKNSLSTPKEVIVDQMHEPRPLPMGRKEFEEWSDRIISGALIPGKEGYVYETPGLEAWDPDSDYAKHMESQKFALANQLLHIGPTESHKPDAYFIHCLRVSAIKQVAVMIGEEYRQKAKDRASKCEA